MRFVRQTLGLVVACVLVGGVAGQHAHADTPTAPDFALRDLDGQVQRLSQRRGSWVVLEWADFACQPVKDLYGAPERKMPGLQRTFAEKGVVWFSVYSRRAGQPGHATAAQCKAALTRSGAAPTSFLLDPDGAVAKAFRVQVTPEIRVISPQGRVVYAGGVEGVESGVQVRWLANVLHAVTGGHAVPYATKPVQGCRLAAASTPATATGPQAPAFTLRDTRGATRRLAEFRGKWVILEWVNYDCPYVKKHYHASHRRMQALQNQAARQGVVWLTICSSAPGKQGHFSPGQVHARMRQLGARPAAYLLDPTGAVGKAYRARMTPGMRVISPQGTIEYTGGIDNIRGSNPGDVMRARNFIALALADIAARRPIGIRRSAEYGCTVKYR